MPPKRLSDCYFYYYSFCVRGDKCKFRHCAEALGTEIVCPGWLEQTCRLIDCKYRHMEIQKDRTQETCFWETQSGGCTKPHCAFYHQSQSRNVHVASGLASVFPPKPVFDNKENAAQKKSLQEALDDSLADYFKKVTPAEDKEYNNPSPKVPPVVFNPWDEESDQEMTSPEKLVEKQIGALERNINVLEEETRNINVLEEETRNINVLEEESRNINVLGEESRVIILGNTTHIGVKSDILSRLGRRITQNQQSGEATPLSLDPADPSVVVGVHTRLGHCNNTQSSRIQIGKVSATSRLGVMNQSSSSAHEESTKRGFENIKVKTLTQIRQEKAHQLRTDCDEPPSKVRRPADMKETKLKSRINHKTKEPSLQKQEPIVSAPLINDRNTSPKNTTIQSSEGEIRIKSFQEIMLEKRKRQEKSKTETISIEQSPPKVLKQEATTTTAPTTEETSNYPVQTTAKRKGKRFRRNVTPELDAKSILKNHEIKKEEDTELETVQSHELETLQSHELETVQSHELETVQSHDAPDSTQNGIVKQELPDIGFKDAIVKREEPGPDDIALQEKTTVSSSETVPIKAESQIEIMRQNSSAKIQESRMSQGSINVDDLDLLLLEGGEDTSYSAGQHIDDDAILKELDNMLQ